MLKQECGSFGSFEYKMPDLAEYLELLGNSGLSAQNLANPEDVNDLVLTARMLKSAKVLVQNINVKVKDEKLESYDDLLKQRELMPFLMEFVGNIQKGFSEADAVKK